MVQTMDYERIAREIFQRFTGREAVGMPDELEIITLIETMKSIQRETLAKVINDLTYRAPKWSAKTKLDGWFAACERVKSFRL